MKKPATTPQFTLRKIQTEFPQQKIKTPQDAANFIRQFYSDDIEIWESVFLLMLNRNNVTTGFAKISQGGTAGTVIDVKIVAKYALDNLASGVIIAHNHPSGNLNPSNQDIEITKRIKDGLKLLDIELADHIILTASSFTSMRQEDLF
jgi:DNA repair protein RadC